MAQAATFICSVSALTDLSVTKVLERVMAEEREERRRNEGIIERGSGTLEGSVCVCVCARKYFPVH